MQDSRHNLLDVAWLDEPAGPWYLPQVIRRQWLVLLFVPLVFAGFGIAYAVLATPLYTATASIEVKVHDPIPAGNDLSLLDTHVELLQSNRVISSVVATLRLDTAFDATPSRLTQLVFAAREWLNLEADDSWSDAEAQSSINRQVQLGLDARRIGNTSVIAISFTSPEKVLSVTVANEFAETYAGLLSSAETQSVERRRGRLQSRAEETKHLASLAEEEATQHILSQGSLAIANAEDFNEQVAELRRELSIANADEAGLRAKLAQVSAAESSGDLEAVALQTEGALAIYEDMVNTSSELARLQQHPGVSSDVITRIENRVAELHRLLEQAVHRVRYELDLELTFMAARRSAISDELSAILNYGRSEAWADLLAAQRKAEVYKNIYQVHLENLEDVNETPTNSSVRLVSEARWPVAPSSPDYKVLLVLSVAIGMVAGAGLAAYREWTRAILPADSRER